MLVVVVDNLLSVIHATVTDLDSVAVEDLSELVILREVFIYQGEESVTDISFDIFTECLNLYSSIGVRLVWSALEKSHCTLAFKARWYDHT